SVGSWPSCVSGAGRTGGGTAGGGATGETGATGGGGATTTGSGTGRWPRAACLGTYPFGAVGLIRAAARAAAASVAAFACLASSIAAVTRSALGQARITASMTAVPPTPQNPTTSGTRWNRSASAPVANTAAPCSSITPLDMTPNARARNAVGSAWTNSPFVAGISAALAKPQAALLTATPHTRGLSTANTSA